METNDRISIVVLTYNRCDEVFRCLRGLIAVAPGIRIIVVDNGSTDGTARKIMQALPQIETVRSTKNLGAAGRNLGVERVATKYVAFADDDTIWEAGALERAAGMLDANPNVAVVSARVAVGEYRIDHPACRAMEESPLDSSGLPGRAILGFMAGASVMRTVMFRAVGGYESRFFLGGEEILMALDFAALGFHMVYCRDVVARHFPSRQRDGKSRRWRLARNAIWTALMRLTWKQALAETRAQIKRMARDKVLLRGMWETVGGLPWALTRRRLVPRHVRQMWDAVHGWPREYVLLRSQVKFAGAAQGTPSGQYRQRRTT